MSRQKYDSRESPNNKRFNLIRSRGAAKERVRSAALAPRDHDLLKPTQSGANSIKWMGKVFTWKFVD